LRRASVSGPPPVPINLERRNAMTKKISLALAMTAMVALAACNTVNGAGKDMKSAGSAVSGASGKDKKN
jgi:predicted small secreted protein